MKALVRAAGAALVLVGVLATRSYSGAPEVSDWDVVGIHNSEGVYSGTAHLVLDQLAAQLSVNATTSSGKTISWSAKGTLDAGALVFKTIDLSTATFPDEIKSDTKATAAYVLNDDGSLAGYWQLGAATASTTGKAKTHSGGTETLTFHGGTPLATPSPAATAALPANALKVPTMTQPDEFGCGAASLQSVLYYYRVSDGDLHDLYKPLGTSASNGTNPPQIVAYAQEHGLTATYVEGSQTTLQDLQNSLNNRDPVMLVIQAWKSTTTSWVDDLDDAHWVVLIGMDSSYAYFMDPWAHFGPGYMPLQELLDRWHCAESHGGGYTTIQHEAIFFHGLAPAKGDGLVRMQ